MSLAALDEIDVIGLPPWVRLRFDSVRDRHVLLAPERVLFPCPTSVMILERVGGEQRQLGELVDVLAAEFEAPRETISADVRSMLQELADQGFLAVNDGSDGDGKTGHG